jgi:hypothetical protein
MRFVLFIYLKYKHSSSLCWLHLKTHNLLLLFSFYSFITTDQLHEKRVLYNFVKEIQEESSKTQLMQSTKWLWSRKMYLTRSINGFLRWCNTTIGFTKNDIHYCNLLMILLHRCYKSKIDYFKCLCFIAWQV